MTFQGGNPRPRDMASSNMSTIYDLWTTDGGEFVAAVVLLGKFELLLRHEYLSYFSIQGTVLWQKRENFANIKSGKNKCVFMPQNSSNE